MYMVKKLVSSLGTIVIISMVVFFMFQVIPGDPVLSQLGAEEMQNEHLVAKLREAFELDVPVHLRYIRWIKKVFCGDLGTSFKYQKSVNELIVKRLVPTLSLAFLSIFVIVFFGICFGIVLETSAHKKKGVFLSVFSQLFLALPNFWLAILLTWFFAFKLGWVNTRVVVNWAMPLQTLKNLVVPVLSLSLGSVALVMRYVKTSISEQQNQDYVKVACSKGLTNAQVMQKHIVKNALLPVVTILSLVFISLLTGSIIIENVFTISGIGSLLIASIKDNDYPLAQGIVLYYSVVVAIVSFVLDMVYAIIDPRVRLGGGKL